MVGSLISTLASAAEVPIPTLPVPRIQTLSLPLSLLILTAHPLSTYTPNYSTPSVICWNPLSVLATPEATLEIISLSHNIPLAPPAAPLTINLPGYAVGSTPTPILPLSFT